MGFRGVKVYAPHGFFPYDERCRPSYQTCVELGVPVMFHTTESEYPLITHYANPLNLQDVQHAYPDLTIILGHAGCPSWHREAVLVACGHPHTYLEVSGWNRLLGKYCGQMVETLHYMKY